MPTTLNCPLCETAATATNFHADAWRFECAVCGNYVIGGSVQAMVQPGYSLHEKRWLLSVLARRASDRAAPLFLVDSEMPELLDADLRPRAPTEAVEEIILRVADNSTIYGASCRIPATEYAKHQLWDREALKGAIHLLRDLKLIDLSASDPSQHFVTLTAPGWQLAGELSRQRGNGLRVFVAMAFDKTLDPVFDLGIRPAVEDDCGFAAIRVDHVQYNDKVDDRIIMELRRSRFVVADFTLHKGGVYFEAGYGLGRGLEVIYSVRHDALEAAHFDTRQYNHIVWQTPEDLREKLTERIRATIPNVPRMISTSP